LKLSRVGIVGAGSWAHARAGGKPLGCALRISRPQRLVARRASSTILIGELEDPAQLAALAACSDVLTFDWENIPGQALAPLERLTQIRPPRAALEVSQDRIAEKALFSKLRIPVAEHAAIDSEQAAHSPRFAKSVSRRAQDPLPGYDGKGQFVVAQLGRDRRGLGRDRRLRVDLREISAIFARSIHRRRPFRGGPHGVLSALANSHGGGILHYSIAPYANPGLERRARIY